MATSNGSTSTPFGHVNHGTSADGPLVNAPSATAVIPGYNAADFIGDAIASLRAQTRAVAEIIVVDDGSHDDTAAVAERAGARVIKQANGGPAAARNTGIRAARTEWIALLDADDLAHPERLGRELPLTIDPTVAVIFAVPRELQRPGTSGHEIDFNMLWASNRVSTSTVLLRRQAWEALGGFDESRALIGVEDYNLWLRLAHAGWRFTMIEELLVDYRPTAASLTNQTRKFATAELTNARMIAKQFGLPAGTLRAKEHAIYLEYGFLLFHLRELSEASDFLREAARRGPIGLGGQLRRWASYLPLSRSARA